MFQALAAGRLSSPLLMMQDNQQSMTRRVHIAGDINVLLLN